MLNFLMVILTSIFFSETFQASPELLEVLWGGSGLDWEFLKLSPKCCAQHARPSKMQGFPLHCLLTESQEGVTWREANER